MTDKKHQIWHIPIHLDSYANKREHWAQEVKRKKKHNVIIDLCFKVQKCNIKPPCRIVFARIGQKIMDYDNLVYAFKRILDKIGSILMPEKAIGHADGSGELKIEYTQSIGNPGEYQVVILIEEL